MTPRSLDFGLAKAMEPAGATAGHSDHATITTPATTRAGMILGTTAYMAPEQARGRPVDKRADIWAFGAVIFEMLTGQRAFDGEDVADVLGAVVRLEPDWATLPPDVPPLVRTGLRRDQRRAALPRDRDTPDVQRRGAADCRAQLGGDDSPVARA